MQRIRYANWWMAFTGILVACTPFGLKYSGVTAAVANDVLVGTAVASLAMAAALTGGEDSIRVMNWITAGLGLWLVLAPFILGYSTVVAALWSDIVGGSAILALSIWSERELPQVVGQAN